MMLLSLLLGCGDAPAEGAGGGVTAERHAPDANATRVEVARIRGDATPAMRLSLPGEIEGSQDVLLASALGGQVERVMIHRGETVRAGQVLARVDAEIYAAQLAQAEAQRDQAAAEAGRVEKLGDLASESQLLQARTALKVAEAQVRAAAAQVARSVVTAPFTGVAADVFPGRGEFLGPGSPVARVVQLDPVRVTLAVADRDVVLLEPGQEVVVSTAASGRPLVGEIAFIGRAADSRTRAFPVEVEVENPDGMLLPGMIATVAVDRPLPEGTIAIPQDWVVSRRSGQGVFVAEEGHAKWVSIELGEILHDLVVVRSGLEAGARVIVTGHRDLVDGDDVLIGREGVCCTDGRTVFGEP
ncbi:MAG: efflux RND transporter periplasmic adaptor subunit [Alphaproteobacteria bacterium]|nr:efflux RND transporter periplasmic adaptor subunit [Alphaproteobacteria bacterium]MCB9693235.1 efflux RND transporter periplasmic adaptor subunit [Alphaproteobacteria bacterium]